jgi:ABC-type uncharacterized transport system ATPase subunit
MLLVTEDLDELFEFADRISVIFESRIVYETVLASADRSYRSSNGEKIRLSQRVLVENCGLGHSR